MTRHLATAHRGVLTASALAFTMLDGAPARIAYYTVALASTTGIVIAIVRRRVHDRAPWIWICAGLAAYLLGDLIWDVLDALGRADGPTAADVAYLAAYALIGIGLFRLTPRDDADDLGAHLDGIILALGLFALMWEVSLAEVLATETLGLGERLVTVAYPLADVVLIVVVARTAGRLDRRLPATWAIVGAVGALAVGDLRWSVLALTSSYSAGEFVDALWLWFFCGLALAAAQPPHRQVRPLPPRRARGAVWHLRLAVVLASVLFIPFLDLVGGRTGGRVSRVLVLAIIGVVVLRLLTLLRSIEAVRRSVEFERLHDRLTTLPNRGAFIDAIRSTGLPPETARIIVLVNLAGFRTINDRLGHEIGDEVLVEVARRLDGVFPTGVLARIGGDEFAVTLTVGGAEGRLEDLARRRCTQAALDALDALTPPVGTHDITIPIDANVGSAFSIAREPDPHALLRSADIALDEARRRGTRHEVFENAWYRRRVEGIQLRVDLQHAVARGQLRLVYQPIIDARTRRISGCEALLRWDHPTRGLVSPLEFIPIAEESGLIVGIGRWALDTALTQLRSWHRTLPGAGNLAVSVNVSGRQLQPDFVDFVRRALDGHRIRPSRLLLEVTESVPVIGGDEALTVLRRLREIGIRLAVDDFGTGYSSLSFLHQFTVDVIKIDRSLVGDIDTSQRANAIVNTVREMTDAVEAVNVAEGVENHEQLERLLLHGCRYLQGYLFAPPLSVEAFEDLWISQLTLDPGQFPQSAREQTPVRLPSR